MLATGSLAKRQMAPASSDSLGSLQRCPVQRHAPSLPRRQRRVATAATLVRQVVVPLAATAALGGLLLTVRRALIARQPAEPQQSRTRQAAARQERREGGSAGGKSGGWPLLPQPPSLQLPAWPGLHNKEQREERQLLSTVRRGPAGCRAGGAFGGGGRCKAASPGRLLAHVCGALAVLLRDMCCCLLGFIALLKAPAPACPQLDEIERRQVLDTRAELQQWDKRLSLRTQTLGELRALAQ